MTISIEFTPPEIKSSFDWQLSQEVNVKNDNNEIIAKAELDIITLNKHRGAKQSYDLLVKQEPTDWEIPLNVCFNKQNIDNDLAEKLDIKIDTKAKQHILLEAISVLPEYRRQGIASLLLQEIVKEYRNVQSISVLSMPMHLFVDVNNCQTQESKIYYQSLNLSQANVNNASLTTFFTHSGFIDVGIDDSALDEPLPFTVFVASTTSIPVSFQDVGFRALKRQQIQGTLI